jgi:hypothetical protein
MATKAFPFHFKILSQGINHVYSTDIWKGKHFLINPYEANQRKKKDSG